MYRNPQEQVSSNALAAASALGKALSANGREVDHSKIPFYNAPTRYSTSMTNLNRAASITRSSSRKPSSSKVGRRSSMYVSTSSTNDEGRYMKENSPPPTTIKVPKQKKKVYSNRRSSSLPSDRHHSITRSQERDAQDTFQEFGGPQSMYINNPPPKTIKKYIPGPNGLIAVEVPIDDEALRRKRGSYSLTSNHTSYLTRTSSMNPYIRMRASSDSLNNGGRLNSVHRSTESEQHNHSHPQSRSNSIAKRREYIDEEEYYDNYDNGNNEYFVEYENNGNRHSIKNHDQNNIPKSKSFTTRTTTTKTKTVTKIKKQPSISPPQHQYQQPKTIPQRKSHFKLTTHKTKPTSPVPMIESYMPEETELELELDSDNLNNASTKKTPSKIELNELLEENIELEEILVDEDESNNVPLHIHPNETYDSIVITPHEEEKLTERTIPSKNEHENIVAETHVNNKDEEHKITNEQQEEEIEEEEFISQEARENIENIMSAAEKSYQEGEDNKDDEDGDVIIKDTTANDDDASDLNIYPYEGLDNDDKKTGKPAIRPDNLLRIKSPNSRSVSSSFYDNDEGIIDSDHGSLDTDISHVSELHFDRSLNEDQDNKLINRSRDEEIQPIILSEQSFQNNNDSMNRLDHNVKSNELGDTVESDEAADINDNVIDDDISDNEHNEEIQSESRLEPQSEKHEALQLTKKKEELTTKQEKGELEALGLYPVENPYLECDDDIEDEEVPASTITENQVKKVTDQVYHLDDKEIESSDYVTTEEEIRPVQTAEIVPPPMSPKRPRENAHPVMDISTDQTHGISSTVTDNVPKITVNPVQPPKQNDKEKNNSQKQKDSIVVKNNKVTMANYLRSANPYLNKKVESPRTTNNQQNTRTTQSTPMKKKASSPIAKTNKIRSPVKKVSAKNNSIHGDLKPPPRLSQAGTPIKSALKKTHSNLSTESSYDSTPANSAYLSLTTAENTRLNARMSNENLVTRKSSTRKVKRPQSMVTQTNQKSTSPIIKETVNKKRLSNIERQPSARRHSKIPDNSSLARRYSKIEPTRSTTTNRTSLIEQTAKEMASDPRMSALLYPAEPLQKKSSFEKLRNQDDHLGFKSLSLRGDMTNEDAYGKSNMSNKFHGLGTNVNPQGNQQQKSQQMMPLTSTMGTGSGFGTATGSGSGWTSRFQDSDSDDDYAAATTHNNGGGLGRSGSVNAMSPSKLKSNGFSLFKSKKHNDTGNNQQRVNQQQDYSMASTPTGLGNKFSKSSLRNASSVEQSPLFHKSGIKTQQQRVHSDPQHGNSIRRSNFGGFNSDDEDDHKTSKFGSKLKKIFGRKK